jgi:hypothetical protein
MVEGVISHDILVYCKNFCKCLSVSPTQQLERKKE